MKNIINITKSDLETLSFVITDTQKKDICESLGISKHTLYCYISGKRRKNKAVYRALLEKAQSNLKGFQKALNRIDKVLKEGTKESKESKQIDLKEAIAQGKKDTNTNAQSPKPKPTPKPKPKPKEDKGKKRTNVSAISPKEEPKATDKKRTNVSAQKSYKEAIQFIMEKRKEGIGYKEIAKELNELGYTNSKGKAFTTDSTRRVHSRKKG